MVTAEAQLYRVRMTARVMMRVQVKLCVKTSLKLIVRASRKGTGQGKVIFQVEG